MLCGCGGAKQVSRVALVPKAVAAPEKAAVKMNIATDVTELIGERAFGAPGGARTRAGGRAVNAARVVSRRARPGPPLAPPSIPNQSCYYPIALHASDLSICPPAPPARARRLQARPLWST